MAAQSDPEKLPKLNWRERLPEGLSDWLPGLSVKSSANGSVKPSAGPSLATSAEASERSPASPPAASPADAPDGSPENTPANGSGNASDGFPPLTFVRIGDTVRVARPPEERLEWTNEDFARLFLWWLATEPVCRNGWVSVHDIETEALPQVSGGRRLPPPGSRRAIPWPRQGHQEAGAHLHGVQRQAVLHDAV